MDLTLQYTQDLESTEGKRLLKELSKFSNKIEEALDFDNFMYNIKSLSESEFYSSSILRTEVKRLNEQEAAELTSQGFEAEVESLVQNAGSMPNTGGGILETLKNLLNTLTEGGTPIGILHLVLDFIGIVGDSFNLVGIPVGMVADFINAMIYFFRGKYILGIISLLAMIPFGGTVALGFKGVAKSFSKPFSKLLGKGAGKEIAKESAEVLAKQSGGIFAKSKRFLNFIKKSAASIAANISKAISFLLESVIAKAVGWVPFIGKPLKKFFTKIADYGKIIADNLTTFAKTVDGPIATQMTKKAAENFAKMEKALATKGGKVVKEGDHLIITAGKGAKPEKILIDEISTFSNISKKFPDGPMKSVLKTSDDVADYYVFLSKAGGKSKNYLDKVADLFVYKGLKVRGLRSFIAKQFVKFLGESGKALSEYEKQAMSDIVTTREINDRMNEFAKNERKRLGADYVVPYVDQLLKDNPDTELREDELANDLQRHLNYNAKRLGLPGFPEYVYAKAKEEKENELAEFYSDHQISNEKYNELMGIKNSGDRPFENINYSGKLKYIKLFENW
jgi:hypothetical protein